MPSIKTNFLRANHQIFYYHYETLLMENHILDQSDKDQIRIYIHTLNASILFEYPVLYSPQTLSFTTFNYMLSRGVFLNAKLQLKNQGNQETEINHIFQLLATKMLRNTELLYSPNFHAVFNPFEERVVNNELSQMPGFSLEQILKPPGIYIIPIKLCIMSSNPLKDPFCKILIDRETGNFYDRNDVVRLDKEKNKVYFRNGKVVLLNNLKNVVLKNLASFELTRKMYQYFQRIKQTSKDLLNEWNVQLDKKFLEAESAFIQVGRLAFRGGVEKSLNQIVFPIARNAYNHYFRLMFQGVVFDDNLQMEMVFFVLDQISQNSYLLVKEFQKLRDQMGLKFQIKVMNLNHLLTFEDIIIYLTNISRSNFMHNFIFPESLTPLQLKVIQQLKQWLIQHSIYFHIISLPQTTDQFDILALRHTSVIYAKNRLNPWKIKEIPFGQKPTVVISLNVQINCNNKYSIAMVCTLNSYLSKFTGVYSLCSQLQIYDNVFECLRECLEKFSSIHKSFPYRVFIFRTGFIRQDVAIEMGIVRNKLTKWYGSVGNTKMNTLTYLVITKSHPLRTYSQLQENSFSSQSVKKVQLLCHIVHIHQHQQHLSEIYIQLELDQPITKIAIYQVEKDPSFINKILELTCKVVYGSVGNQYGKGLGFIDFATKLNQYRDFNLQGWKLLIKDSIMMFL